MPGERWTDLPEVRPPSTPLSVVQDAAATPRPWNLRRESKPAPMRGRDSPLANLSVELRRQWNMAEDRSCMLSRAACIRTVRPHILGAGY